MKWLISLILMAFSGLCLADTATKLSEGHQPLAQTATTLPAQAIGKLTIKAVVKSNGAPAPMNAPVVIHFYTGEQESKHVDAFLDARGMAIIDKVELTSAPTQAVAHVQYNDISYRAVSPVMSVSEPETQVEIPLYATSSEIPGWRILMRHVMVQQQPEGMRVLEMIALNNPSDRTWVKKTGENETHATVMIKLPEGAGDLELGEGFGEASARVENQTLYYLEPVLPGTMRLQFAYTVPVNEGKARIPIIAPAATSQLIVFMPDDGSTIQAQNLVGGESKVMEKGGKTRMYQASGLEAGAVATLTVTGLKSMGASSSASGMSMPQIIAAIGAGCVLVIGVVVMLLKPARKTEKQG